MRFPPIPILEVLEGPLEGPCYNGLWEVDGKGMVERRFNEHIRSISVPFQGAKHFLAPFPALLKRGFADVL